MKKHDLKKELEKALADIGPICPWRDKEVGAWVFEHADYPVRYAGNTAAEVKKGYPLYLQEFIEERLSGNLAPHVEKATKGWGGQRTGSGRRRKQATRLYRLPTDVGEWLKEDEDHLEDVRRLMG